ncbi:MAG: polyhydroxyalkanoate depolymerase [Comamonadaceae bacterium]|nr:polyhydroxyalkanoate depolymerase [Comamonadaceae bacterium]
MLYQIYEAQRSLIEPFSDLAEATAKLYGNPHSLIGQLPMAQRISAGYALMHRLGKDYEKPEFGIRKVEVDGVEVAIDERVEIDKPFCELRRFKRFTDDPATLAKLKNQPPVLIVAPLSGHYATLLRDTVRTMLEGHKVYITDWKNARTVPLSEGEFHLDDYVNDVQEFIRHLQGTYGNCHVVSVCQPTVPVLAAISLMASRGEKTPLTMTMMGGPIDARKSPTAVNNLATNKSIEWFQDNVIFRVPPNYPGAGRRVYPGFLQHAGFIAMNPDRHASSHYDFFKDLIKGDESNAESHRKFYDEYNAVLDMDADYYLETIQAVFQDFKLVNGTMEMRSVQGKVEPVRPQDIKTTALFTIEGELDDISGSGQTQAAHDLCTGLSGVEKRHLEVKGAGHYGIFSGRRWRDVVYPQVKAFINRNGSPEVHDEKPAPSASKPARITESESSAEDSLAPVKQATDVTPSASKSPAKPVTTFAKAPAQSAVNPVAKRARVAGKAVEAVKESAATEAKPAVKSVVKPAAKTTASATVKPVTKPAVKATANAPTRAAKTPATRRKAG